MSNPESNQPPWGPPPGGQGPPPGGQEPPQQGEPPQWGPPGGQEPPQWGPPPGQQQGYPGQPPGYQAPPPGYEAPQQGYPGGQAGYPGAVAPYGQPGYPGSDPAAPYGRDPRTGEPYSDKQKLVAGLLQLFLGGFGAGRWYLGDTGIAVAQLLTCGGLGIWALIDGIQILMGNVRDNQGRPLRD
jgi:hypothetical protein